MVSGDNNSTSFSDTGTLLDRKKVVPITSLDAASKQIKARAVLCTLSLGDSTVNPSTQELKYLVNETEVVSALIHAQAQLQPYFPANLLLRLKYGFNEIFRQALERRHQVRWLFLDDLRFQLTTGHFQSESVYMSGAISAAPHPPPA